MLDWKLVGGSGLEEGLDRLNCQLVKCFWAKIIILLLFKCIHVYLNIFC